ncbi:MAG: hypothetical protein ACK4Q4_00565 [Rhodocyclaceae bacterium]
MPRRRTPKDPRQTTLLPELLDPVQRFEPMVTAAATMTGRICRALKAAIEASKKERVQVAKEMGDYLGQPVPKATLDKYVSEGSRDHEIPVTKFMALAHATGEEHRLLNILAEPLGYIVVPRHCEAWIKAGQLAQQIQQQRTEVSANEQEFKLAVRMAQHLLPGGDR